jgi:energy-coupling factor transport system permease protein
MRAAIAYTPRPRPLQSAAPQAAIAYLGSFVVVAFAFFSPVVLAAAAIGAAIAGVAAGAGRAVGAATRAGLALTLLITIVNGLVTDRGVTVLARLGEFPLLGQVNVTAEALAAGAAIGLRILAAMIACAVYSACVDPDRVLRLLRPVAGRSALTATLISRLVPVALSDATRLSEAARLRGPAAAAVGRGAFARRLLAGSLDRSVDVAATLELRGYGLNDPGKRLPRERSRYDRRFFAAGAALTLAAAAVLLGGGASFDTYPRVALEAGVETWALAAATIVAGLAPLRRRPRRKRSPIRREVGGA